MRKLKKYDTWLKRRLEKQNLDLPDLAGVIGRSELSAAKRVWANFLYRGELHAAAKLLGLSVKTVERNVRVENRRLYGSSTGTAKVDDPQEILRKRGLAKLSYAERKALGLTQ